MLFPFKMRFIPGYILLGLSLLIFSRLCMYVYKSSKTVVPCHILLLFISDVKGSIISQFFNSGNIINAKFEMIWEFEPVRLIPIFTCPRMQSPLNNDCSSSSQRDAWSVVWPGVVTNLHGIITQFFIHFIIPYLRQYLLIASPVVLLLLSTLRLDY